MDERQISAKSIFIKYKNNKKQQFTKQHTLNEYENTYNGLSSKLISLLYDCNLSEQNVKHITIGFSHLKEVQNVHTQIKFETLATKNSFNSNLNQDETKDKSTREQDIINKANFYFSKHILVDLETFKNKKKYNAKVSENDNIKFKV